MTRPVTEFIEPGDLLRPFPPAEEVFVPEQAFLIRHLHPLVSINLHAVNPTWSGSVHLLSPLEPYAGVLGEHTEDFHNAFVRTNGFILQMDGDRCRFMGDPRYFLMEHQKYDLPHGVHEAYDELAEHYQRAEASYRRARAAYLKHAKLYLLDDKGEIARGNPEPQPLIEQLGGKAGYANWTVTSAFPVEPTVRIGDAEPDQVWPLSPAGRRFEFIAATQGWLYRHDGADAILLFYEPIEKLVLLTFDWT